MTAAPSAAGALSRTISRLDPFESHQVFRTLLDTLARPGRIGALPTHLVGRHPPVLLPLLALADVDVKVAVVSDDASTAGRWCDIVTGVTGAPCVDAASAKVVAALEAPTPELIEVLRAGTHEAPEAAAWLAIACTAVAADESIEGASVTVSLSGPGVASSNTVHLGGIDARVITAIRRRNRSYPSGIDTWFIAAEGAVAAVPRTSRIELLGSRAG